MNESFRNVAMQVSTKKSITVILFLEDVFLRTGQLLRKGMYLKLTQAIVFYRWKWNFENIQNGQ